MNRKEPMLCASYRKDKPLLTAWPQMLQPKLNGYRCLLSQDDSWTRTLREQPKDLKWYMFNEFQDKIPDGVMLDGEIYHHGTLLQDIRSLALTWRLESSILQYCVYDLFDKKHPDAGFRARHLLLKELVHDFDNHHIYICPTNIAARHLDVEDALKFWLGKGYEGIVIRDPNSPYHSGRKGRDIQKYKPRVNDEWSIVDVYQATGKDAGTSVFECMTKNGLHTFRVPMTGKLQYRRKLWRDRMQLVGKQLTVQYCGELTAKGCPIAAYAIAVRDYE